MDGLTKYYDVYYKNFTELLDNLSIIRPYDTSLFLFKSSTGVYVSTYGVRSLVETVNMYIKDYAVQILKKDESFFLENLELHFEDNSFVVNEIKKIKDIWIDPKTSPQHKEIIWKHFIIFAKISKVLK